ncbi:hypothetical protein Tco_0522798 [Tanacetum coccineum]
MPKNIEASPNSSITSKAIVSKVSTVSSTPAFIHVAELKEMVRVIEFVDKKNQTPSSRSRKSGRAKLCNLRASTLMLSPLERTKSPALTKTRMILELADRTISTPTGIAEDVFVKVGTTARALIDVHGEQMTLRHDDQSVTFKVGDTKTFSYNIIESVNRVDVIDIACEEYVQEVLEISKSGNPTSTSDLMIDSRSPSFTPSRNTVYLEELLSVINSDPNLPPSPVCEINVPEKVKSSCEDPPDLELKDLPSHLDIKCSKGYEDTNLALNWEKCHFMVQGRNRSCHKISKSGIRVDKSKVDVIASYLIHTGKHKYTDTVSVSQVPACLSRMQSQDWLGGFAAPRILMSVIRDKKGAKNLAADHLSRLENPHQSELEKKEITETFPLETLGMVTFHGDDNASCDVGVVFRGKKLLTFSKLATVDPPGDTTVPITPLKRSLIQDFIGPRSTRMPMTLSPDVTFVNVKAKFRNVMRCHKTLSMFAKFLTFGEIDFKWPFPSQEEPNITPCIITYRKWVEAKALPTKLRPSYLQIS